MKKYIIIGSLFVVTIVFFYFYHTIKKEYLNNVYSLNENTPVFIPYTMAYEDYFDIYHSIPKNKKEIDSFIKSINNPRYSFHDPFSKTNSELLYIPLYSRQEKFCEGYLLISSGIDGEMNTIVEDTVFLDEINRFDLYNPYPIKTTYKGVMISETFDVFEYLFGERDLVIEYINWVECYKNGAKTMGIYSPMEFYNKFKKHLKRESFSNTCVIRGKVIGVNDSSFTISDSVCKVHFDLSNFNRISPLIKENVMVAAKYVCIEDKTKTLFFKNAIILE